MDPFSFEWSKLKTKQKIKNGFVFLISKQKSFGWRVHRPPNQAHCLKRLLSFYKYVKKFLFVCLVLIRTILHFAQLYSSFYVLEYRAHDCVKLAFAFIHNLMITMLREESLESVAISLPRQLVLLVLNSGQAYTAHQRKPMSPHNVPQVELIWSIFTHHHLCSFKQKV